MIITDFVIIFIKFVSSIFDGMNLNVNYEEFLGAFDVLSYGVYVLGAPLFYAILTSMVTFYMFKLVFAIINWVWQQLPLT